MKKFIFIGGLALFFLGSAVAAQASLWNFYSEQNLPLPSFSARVQMAEQLNIHKYRGTALQNAFLEAYLRQRGKANTVKYWTERLKSGKPLRDMELRQIPEEAWAEIENQVIRLILVPQDDFLGSGSVL